jgi:hypothetical protein
MRAMSFYARQTCCNSRNCEITTTCSCEDEYDLYQEWTQLIEARPRYINIMYGWITDKDEQAWNDDEN